MAVRGALKAIKTPDMLKITQFSPYPNPDLFHLQVAYAKKDLQCDIILDMATLTGAQGVATGRYHASLLTNREEWEPVCAKAGRASGDMVVSDLSPYDTHKKAKTKLM